MMGLCSNHRNHVR